MSKPTITSEQNQQIRDALRLRDRRRRAERQAFLIDGLREISCASDCGLVIVTAFVNEVHRQKPAVDELAARLTTAGTVVHEVAAKAFQRLAYGDRDDGMVAVAEMPSSSLATLALPPSPLVVVVEGLEKPGNLGAVLRCADGAGADVVLVAEGITDLYNPNVVRASMGTLFALDVIEVSTPEAMEWLRRKKLSIVAARPNGDHRYDEVDLRRPTAIVLGSEAEGLSGAWQADDIETVSLPMLGCADSLNVSAAAAVLLYEAVRQRQQHRGGDTTSSAAKK